MTTKAPVLLLSDKLFELKIENFTPKNRYNLYLLTENNNYWDLYIFVKEPTNETINLNSDEIKKVITISEHYGSNVITLKLLTEHLLNTTKETQQLLQHYTFHLEKDINLEEYLDKYKIDPSGNSVQYNEAIPKIQEELKTKSLTLADTQSDIQQDTPKQYNTANPELLTNYLENCINEIVKGATEINERKKREYENEIRNKFEVYTNSGANNCFFIAIAQALKFAIESTQTEGTVGKTAEETANKLGISIDELLSKTPDELQQNIRNFVAKYMDYDTYVQTCRINPDVDPNCRFMRGVETKEQFQAKIKSSEFQANESVYAILKEHANIHSVNIPVYSTNYKKVFKCQYNRNIDKENDTFILLQFKEDPAQQNSHYELIGYKKHDNFRTLFKFDELPSFIRENYKRECTGSATTTPTTTS